MSADGLRHSRGHGDDVVAISDARRPSGDDPYSGGTFQVALRGIGLSVSRTVFIYGSSGLGAYFAELADAWRGWDGVKEWHSPEVI